MEDVQAVLESWFQEHEELLELTRKIRIECSNYIAFFHRGEERGLPEEEVKQLLSILNKKPEILWHTSSAIFVALQEFVEAIALKSIVKEDRLPEPAGFPPHAYLCGLADVVGELKRYFLERMIEGDFKEAERILNRAKEVFDYLSQFHYPDAILPGFRRKKDVARALISSMLHIYAEAKIRGGLWSND